MLRSLSLPGDIGEGQVALRGLIWRDGDGLADRDDLVGGVRVAHAVALDVAEVHEEGRVALVQHLKSAQTPSTVTRSRSHVI